MVGWSDWSDQIFGADPVFPQLRHKIHLCNVHEELAEALAIRRRNKAYKCVLFELEDFHESLAKPNYIGLPPACKVFDWLRYNRDGTVKFVFIRTWKPRELKLRRDIYEEIRYGFANDTRGYLMAQLARTVILGPSGYEQAWF